MKTFLILLLFFYFLSCKQDSNDSQRMSNKDNTIFTITHKAGDYKNIFIFFQENSISSDDLIEVLLDHKNPPPYKIAPNECLRLTASQFDNLIVLVGRGISKSGGTAYNKTLCSSFDEKKCSPHNYEISLKAGLIILKTFILKPIDKPNPSAACVNIETWIKNKEKEHLENNPKQKQENL